MKYMSLDAPISQTIVQFEYLLKLVPIKQKHIRFLNRISE